MEESRNFGSNILFIFVGSSNINSHNEFGIRDIITALIAIKKMTVPKVFYRQKTNDTDNTKTPQPKQLRSNLCDWCLTVNQKLQYIQYFKLSPSDTTPLMPTHHKMKKQLLKLRVLPEYAII
jgi:hypothetical protein